MSRCFEKSCPFFPHHHRTFKKASASRESCLCLCLLEGLFMLRILLCAHLLWFQSIPPCRLLSPSTVPITYSAQSLPPPQLREWTSPHPQRGMTDRSEVLTTFTHTAEAWRGNKKKKSLFPQKTDKRTENELRGGKKRHYIHHVVPLWLKLHGIYIWFPSTPPQFICAPLSWYFHQTLRNRCNESRSFTFSLANSST